MTLNFRIALSIFSALSLLGCVTPGEKKEMKQDIFGLQTRTLQLENMLRERETDLRTTDDAASKRIASTATEAERLRHDIQVLQGEIDALKIGVRTGSMPGANPDEESVARTLSSIVTRLEAVEAGQTQILDAIDKFKGKSAAAGAKPSTTADSSRTLDQDFASKNYQAVVDRAPAELKGANNKSKQQKIVYYVAESLFQLKKPRDAALKFNEYLELGGTKYLAQAKLRLGDCFRDLGDTATAKLYYEELMKDFPASAEAKRAEQALGRLGSKGANRSTGNKSSKVVKRPEKSNARKQ